MAPALRLSMEYAFRLVAGVNIPIGDSRRVGGGWINRTRVTDALHAER
jgi:hypothetical protein